jgi:hypothetical protein
MTEEKHDAVHEFHRIKALAAQGRVQAIRSQIALGVTFCRVAESQLQFQRFDDANEVMMKLKKLTATVDRHLREPGHVPAHDSRVLFAELMELENRIHAVRVRQARLTRHAR